MRSVIKFKRFGNLFFFAFFIVFVWYIIMISNVDQTAEPINIVEDLNVEELRDLTEEEVVELGDQKLIFFHETSNQISYEAQVLISPRRACAVESAAKHNPNSTIFLLYATLLHYENYSIYINTSETMFQSLLSYENIRIRRAGIKAYAEKTPLEEWVTSGKIESSKFLFSHFSDVMRYLTLWKFGGTYLDLDVVVLKDLEPLGENYAVAESTQFIAAGMLNFDRQGPGHYIMDRCINEIRTNFRGDIWTHNGPGVITRTLVDVCKTKDFSTMTKDKCNGFAVFPPSVIYPIGYGTWRLYFDPNKIKEVLEKIKDSAGVHVWNKLSTDEKIDVKKPEVPYTYLARNHCPIVFSEVKDYF